MIKGYLRRAVVLVMTVVAINTVVKAYAGLAQNNCDVCNEQIIKSHNADEIRDIESWMLDSEHWILKDKKYKRKCKNISGIHNNELKEVDHELFFDMDTQNSETVQDLGVEGWMLDEKCWEIIDSEEQTDLEDWMFNSDFWII